MFILPRVGLRRHVRAAMRVERAVLPLRMGIEAEEGRARRTRIQTAHARFETPCFMPVGTLGSVKGLLPRDLVASGARILLANAYHLLLRPGLPVLLASGGLRGFMRWKGAILTDSGGFQAMSLGKLVSIEEEGILFRSHVDGTRHRLTPERAMQVQIACDSTIAMALDQCVSHTIDSTRLQRAVERSAVWGVRSLTFWRAHARRRRALFGILQGGVSRALRRESLDRTGCLDFDGYAIGGLATGESAEQRNEILDFLVPLMPVDKPRYLMGVGKPVDIANAVACGVDMFDCVLPTRSGRTGQAFCFDAHKIPQTRNLRNARYQTDFASLEQDCPCMACAQGFSRAYLHHLFKSGEMLGPMLLSMHNLVFYQQLMAEIRDSITAGLFARLHQRLQSTPEREDS